MLFSQLTFLVFFLIVFVANLLTLRSGPVNRMVLLVASLLFFAYWSLSDLGLMLVIVTGSYVGTRWVDGTADPGRRRRWLILTVGFDLACLCFFKYGDFLRDNLRWVVRHLGADTSRSGPAGTLPLGISFYTFHCLSYVVDVYKSKYKCASPVKFLIYISLFPQMIAGPIVRGNQLIPQIEAFWKERRFRFCDGVYVFLLGFFFKAVCADNLSDLIDPHWTQTGVRALTWGSSWLVLFLYSCQIFADFSGYSLMAIGLGYLLGFSLPENFNAPYSACSFSDFWRRWHMTLSSFLRDYLYIDLLGGNRKGSFRTYLNLMVTMLLGGLWHGPSWTFVTWGGIHGAALCVERWLGLDQHSKAVRWYRTAGWALTVQFTVMFAWVMFRSPTFSIAARFVQRMFVPRWQPGQWEIPHSLMTGLVLAIPVVLHHVSKRMTAAPPWVEAPAARGAMAGVLLCLIVLFVHQPQGFIYFTF